MLNCPVTKHFCFPFCTAKCGVFSEKVTRANPHFFINKISKFVAAMIIQIFHLFVHEIAKNYEFLCSFCNVFTLYISRKIVGSVTVIQTSTFPHNSVHQFLVHQIACLLGLNFFEGQNEYLWTFPSKTAPDSLMTFVPASSISTSMQDILLEKSTELTKQGREGFT